MPLTIASFQTAGRGVILGPAMAHESEVDDDAPGWQAIDAAWRRIHGDQEPHFALGGKDPLDGISFYVVDAVLRVLPGRLPFDREFTLAGPEKSVAFRRATAPACATGEEGNLIVDAPSAFAPELAAALKPQRGMYLLPCHPSLQIRVVPSEIKDSDGRVVQVIG
jgi:hypothetical protein